MIVLHCNKTTNQGWFRYIDLVYAVSVYPQLAMTQCSYGFK